MIKFTEHACREDIGDDTKHVLAHLLLLTDPLHYHAASAFHAPFPILSYYTLTRLPKRPSRRKTFPFDSKRHDMSPASNCFIFIKPHQGPIPMRQKQGLVCVHFSWVVLLSPVSYLFFGYLNVISAFRDEN